MFWSVLQYGDTFSIQTQLPSTQLLTWSTVLLKNHFLIQVWYQRVFQKLMFSPIQNIINFKQLTCIIHILRFPKIFYQIHMKCVYGKYFSPCNISFFFRRPLNSLNNLTNYNGSPFRIQCGILFFNKRLHCIFHTLLTNVILYQFFSF